MFCPRLHDARRPDCKKREPRTEMLWFESRPYKGGGAVLLEDERKRILIADDNKDLLTLMQSILEFAGFLVQTAEDGEEALDQVKKVHYDLLVLGVVMPRVDGIKLLQLVRTRKEYASVPIIFITCSSWKQGTKHPREMSCKLEGFRKPFKNKAFLKMVTALLGSEQEEARYN
ncbi:MAG: response regulator [Candidatus Abyssobacteria bacterium SURF_5]|uniref:Response regulator n=1 Tax=Abyssobacteria bacterium (strain SURF_5) TaxID=2093360 RepID=A0A3A4NT07_ABYX5|nr:MAG: response regulator [Candidatus Abyssubacteria bacterium SURF_5]